METTVAAGRGVIEVAGPDARALLQRLITNDVEGLAPGEARYAALLTPQGKIVADFIVVASPQPDAPERFLLDCPSALAAALAKKLTMYRLRADVTVSDLSAESGALPLLEEIAPGASGLVVYADPRSPALGSRAIGQKDVLTTLRVSPGETEARRIRAGVPEGGVDFAYDDAFPHEANLDRLNGVDFGKGCYVGQEVVSRMQHRATVRKRVVAVRFDGDAPPPGTPVLAGTRPIGAVGSSVGREGLALLRIDHATEDGASLTAAGVSLRLD